MTMTQFQLLLFSALLLLCQAATTPTPAPNNGQPKSTVSAQPVPPQPSVPQASPKVQSQAKQQDAKCLEPLDPGPCRMSLERFYYNKQTNSCEAFKYGGCRGNDNRWGFRQTCEEACATNK